MLSPMSETGTVADWMAHNARKGIYDVIHHPYDLSNLEQDQIIKARDRLHQFVEEIKDHSRYLHDKRVRSGSNDFRILDTALYDAGFVFDAMLEKASVSNHRVAIRVLLANPNSEFARARNQALGTDPVVRLTGSLNHICNSLSERNYCARPDFVIGDDSLNARQKISGLLSLISNEDKDQDSQQTLRDVTCNIRLYNGPLFGPSYFFQNILLQGKYISVTLGSANVMPWLVLVNNQYVSHDIYDTYAFEFENLWNSSSASAPRTRPDEL